MIKVYTEVTLNPNIIQFTCEEGFESESTQFDKNSDTSDSPLAEELLELPFISKVFMTGNTVSVMKDNEVEWREISDLLRDTVNRHLAERTILIDKSPKKYIFRTRTEKTDDPEKLKFITNGMILQGKMTASNKEEAEDFPLARNLMAFDYVKEVVISGNFVIIKKAPEIEWKHIKADLTWFIGDFMTRTS